MVITLKIWQEFENQNPLVKKGVKVALVVSMSGTICTS